MAKDYTKCEVSGMDKAFNKSRLAQEIPKLHSKSFHSLHDFRFSSQI